MKSIHLHGPIGEGLPALWELNVSSAAEAIRAINVNTDGKLLENLVSLSYRDAKIGVICLDEERTKKIQMAAESECFDRELIEEIFLPEEELLFKTKMTEIHFVPVIDGQVVTAAIGTAITTAVGAIGASMAAMSFTQMAFMMVGSMLVSGIAAAMFPPV